MSERPVFTAARFCWGAALAVAFVVGCDRHGDHDSTAPFPSQDRVARGQHRPRSGQTYRLGERAEAADFGLVVEEIKTCRSEHLSAGDRMVGVRLTVQGRADHEIHFNPFHCRVEDNLGNQTTPTFNGCEPRLRDVRLAKDEQANGWVSFELQQNALGLVLNCTRAQSGPDTRILRFELAEGASLGDR